MINELNESLNTYNQKWSELVAARKDQKFFTALKPIAVGWKVADQAGYDKVYNGLHDQCDRNIETWMNGRWIAELHLKDITLEGGITIIKLMQRRPGSDDALGLDHVDFYSPRVVEAEHILQTEQGIEWSWETNNVIAEYNWISLWFDGTEAKLKSDTVLDIVQAELRELNEAITKA
jgi:hypothetical protein